MDSAVDISKYIVAKCINDEYPITNIQLQKILYSIQKAFLKHGQTAFNDRIEAWQYGPVVPASYYTFCGCGGMPILLPFENCIIPNVKAQAIIDPIVDEKRQMDAWELVKEIHKPGGAWDRVYQGGKGNRLPISLDLIKKYG